MTIGQRIKAARERAGITQVDLGAKIGVSGVAVMRYEKDARQPRLEQLRRIALALGTTVSELVEPSYWATVSKEEYAESGGWDEPTVFQIESVSDRERAMTALDQLNEDGQRVAADAVELIAEIPRYRRQEPPQPPATPPEGRDTTPAVPPPESAENGR